MSRRRSALSGALCAVALAMAPTWDADAAIPAKALVEGVLKSSSGAPATDGTYDVSFAIYSGQSATNASWTEGPVKVTVSGGRFVSVLGGSKALDAKALAGLAEPWLGVKVGAEPELPRHSMASAIYALAAGYAVVAAGVECTGCTTAGALAKGHQRWMSGKGMVICNGAQWVSIASTPIIYTCHCNMSRYYV